MSYPITNKQNNQIFNARYVKKLLIGQILGPIFMVPRKVSHFWDDQEEFYENIILIHVRFKKCIFKLKTMTIGICDSHKKLLFDLF